MTDLPENELLSAYLDGELTAAEQAEMEQLLATNPAARQLLDEFRTLSQAVQSLPHEELGEDISRQVLRVAERRMLTEGGPTETKELAKPLPRTISQRFLTRRNLVWLSLTGVVAVMIAINEHREGAGPMSQMAREVARAPAAADNRAPRLSGPPPTIQAAPDASAESSKVSKESKSIVAKSTVAKEPVPMSPVAPPASRPTAAAAPRAMAEKPAAQPKRELVMKRAGPKDEAPGLVGRGGAMADNVDRKDSADVAVNGKRAGQAKRAESAKKADSTEDALVIHCGIKPRTGQRALEKLLEANGLAWNVQKGQSLFATPAPAPVRAKKAKQEERSDRDAETAETVIAAEATPDQIEAIFAGLAAKPEVFVSISVNPLREESSRKAEPLLAGSQALRSRAAGGKFEYTQRTQVAGSDAGRGAAGELDMTVSEEAAPSNMQQQSSQDGKKRQVLFVLRLVDTVNAAPAAAPVPAKGK